MIETLTTDNSDACLVAEEKYRARMQVQNDAIKETYNKIKEMPWQEVLEHGSEIGTTMILDTLAFHAVGGLASRGGNLVIEELSSAIESGAILTEEYAVEVAGFGKLMIEEGVEVSSVVNQAVKNDATVLAKNIKPASQQVKQKTSPLTNEAKTPIISSGSVLKSDISASNQIALSKFQETKHFRDVLDEHIEKLLKKANPQRCGKVLPDDATVLKRAKTDALTEIFYNDIRNTTIDIEAISKNTGIPKDIIQKIKSHVFLEDHILYEGIGKFGIDEDMAAAWQRLIDNKFNKSDLILLQHEYAESLLMNGTEIAYSDAHPLVNQRYDWYRSL
jgi:hypothetical protein